MANRGAAGCGGVAEGTSSPFALAGRFRCATCIGVGSRELSLESPSQQGLGIKVVVLIRVWRSSGFCLETTRDARYGQFFVRSILKA